MVSSELKRLLRYLVVGLLAWAVDLAVFLALIDILGVPASQLAARLTGAAVAFFGHKLLVFREPGMRAATLASQGARYAALWVLAYAVSTLALIGLIEHAAMAAVPAKVLVEAGIVVMNYVIMKTLIFQDRSARGIGE
jgi:putative flippase GtrA